ncbi:IS21 family transposase [Alicyclobacillus sp. ALC3]|uniref:IS21 family transposase n=1 Tax=Alicyclobacillus sp. ALC3 TaxID=2796143 RepID=UPI002379B4B0|nr:IS21 family transposase [Alicyclobacillus sp. ALC3]WDL98474.1 IS21 family transposase [Alicyclobacillus sp. ALC3]
MGQIELVKEMQAKGLGPVEISNRLRIDRKTVRKYMQQEDFSPNHREVRIVPSKLDPYKETILSWLEEDKRNRYKQRHTAKRIHQRLKEQFQDEYTCSYETVQRYVKAVRGHQNNEGTLELVWPPGECQVDFGEADFYIAGQVRAYKYLCVSFPHSNAAYAQLFGGETAECVVHGLQDVFQHIGGIPTRLVFDNATGVGRRIGEQIRMTELFLRFKAHCGFEVTFCNPYAGYEKGNVENKVGYIRRNFFVPLPSFLDVQDYNRSLLSMCERDWDREHYKLGENIRELFEQDRQSLMHLPRTPFNPYRYERVKTDGYGKFVLDGCHHYSSAPEYAVQELVIRIGAHTVAPLAADGSPITQHERGFGKGRTDTVDHSTTLSRMLRNPGAWRNSGLRNHVPDELRTEMDSFDRAGLKTALKMMLGLSGQYGFDAAVQAMTEATKLGRLCHSNAAVLAARLTTFAIDPDGVPGLNLDIYDEAFLPEGGEVQ